ncbi:L-talarate/galactarate dehydratase [Halomonas ramblicola]|uniref:L-talarate/galactarate dehydratase n=1 Tax=Halomonas ramblicola TaxID=747349 RepID=UPI0025B52FFA|nr:mandelate racemase/muconate lactonizing enzyme family protein [Halomonas ramblicola]MDN3520447.1 mandelate racemase/muconate lactonizing enzyme family protein [Halomonas ramblicola]
MTKDKISRIELSRVILPLSRPISDAKVMTGRQTPMKEMSLLFAELESRDGHSGMGFGYVLRSGGKAQYAHAQELAPFLIGEDPNDIPRLWERLAWQGASVGRSGVAVQAIAAFDTALWDMKARRAGLSLAKLLGSHREAVPCYNTSGGYYGTSIDEVCANADRSLDDGIGGVKMKVGQPDVREDIERVTALRKHLGAEVPIMIDANQQWDRPTALRFGRAVDELGLTWIEEPLDAQDVEGHAELNASLDTPIATGEMLTSAAEHQRLIDVRAVSFVQPDAPRIGGVTPFLKVATLADQAGLQLAPHFVMEIHLHLCAAYPTQTWVEHFEWLEPLFEERLEIREGHMIVPDRPGLGLTLSEQARHWTRASEEFR